MSEQTIREKSQVIRNETNKYANTRERVADVLDDINETKANKDASELSEEDKRNWREELDIYDKKSIDENKLDKPTREGTTATSPYVLGLNAENRPERLPAGDLGKNSANADLTTTGTRTFTQAHIYTWNTAGFHYRITGLPDKSSDSTFNRMRVQDANGQEAWGNGKTVLESLMANLPSVKDERTGNYNLAYNEYLVYDPITGKFAKSDRPQIVSNFNVPQNLNISYPTTIANSNYTPSPTTPQDIRETFDMIKRLENSYDFTLVTPDMWVLRTMADEKIAPYSSWRVPRDINQTTLNGTLNLKSFTPPEALTKNTDFLNSVADNDTFWSVYLNKEFPKDKDWIIRIRSNNKGYNNLLTETQGSFFGMVDEISERNDNLFFQTDAWSDSPYENWKGLGGTVIFNRQSLYEIFLIKKGSKLSLFMYLMKDGRMSINTIDYQDKMKYLRFGTSIRYISGMLVNPHLIGIGYWIQS